MLLRHRRTDVVAHLDAAQRQLAGARPVGRLVEDGDRVRRGVEPAPVLGEGVVDDELGLALVVAGRRQLLLCGRAVAGGRGDVGDQGVEGGEAHVLTAPLVINKQTGVKFGKSEGGAVWLDPALTSPYKFYQFWLNCDDETSEDLIKIYTLLDQATIETLIDTHRANPGARTLQKALAREVTDIVHGHERRESVERVTSVLFGNNDLSTLREEDLDALANEIPTVSPQSVVAALVEAGVCASNGEARRLIKNNAISLDGVKITSDQPATSPSLIKKGKNSFVLVR